MVLVLLFAAGYVLARSAPAGDQEDHVAKVRLEPENGSRVHGTARFEAVSGGGTEITLEVAGLGHRGGKQTRLYLAHVHEGTCAEGEEHESGQHAHEASEGGAIDFPLSPVDPDAGGEGRSVTMLRDASFKELFSDGPKHLNVHATGSGDPPVLTCGDLRGVTR
jgi:hypothetical protein